MTEENLSPLQPKDIELHQKVHPLVSSMPPHLKDPKNYLKIKKFILESLASSHSHGEVVEWATCASCQRRFHERGEILKKIGFSSTAQYMVWQRIHEMMGSAKRHPLPKYNS